ncbi:MAG: hypothetical protein PHU85_11955 [Phycisphaerae bacterium]|nr:hypothetical protein [Phycisphaerae bacterium]
MTNRVVVLLLVLLVFASPAVADEIAGVERPKPDPNAAQNGVLSSAPKASAVFTATVTDVKMLARTASVPPTVAMTVTLKDPEMLKGDKPATLTFGYAAKQGWGLFPQAGQKVIAVAMPTQAGLRIVAMSDASADNLAAVKKVLGPAPTSQPTSQPAGAPDAAAAVKLAGEFLTAAKERATRMQAFPIPAPADDWWMVEYHVEGGLAVSPGPAVFVNKKTGEVTRQSPKGMPPRM